MKSIIFTVDTESDNQWDILSQQTTNNSRYIPKFQDMCESYGVIPDYLIDYSMANDSWLADYLNMKSKHAKCEIGMHLHAWDTPPRHEFDYKTENRPYLIEYPREIMEEKISTLTQLLTKVYEQKIVVHRAGRWAMNEMYFQILSKHGYLVDCSVTPGIDWRSQKGAVSGGSDYRKEKSLPWMVTDTNILEVPMSVKKLKTIKWDRMLGYMSNMKRCIKTIVGNTVWLRPALFGKEDMLELCNTIDETDNKYVEFMIHSSELMPKGSPYIRNEEELDLLYYKMNFILDYLTKNGYIGTTLSQYRNMYIEGKDNEK